jgi:uncharacterized protein YbjT (DUF2867 family)
MKQSVALLLGASGSVGFEVLRALCDNPAFEKVVVFVRKPFDASQLSSANKLVQRLVPQMTASDLSDAVAQTIAEYPADVEYRAFSALGVGAKTAALTIDQHRAIDVQLNQAFAQALQRSPQVKYLGFLSAMGANPQAKTTGSGAAGMARYSRVKGEAEEAVKLHGPKGIGIFRPAIIRGSQHTPKILNFVAPVIDALIPRKFHSISTRQIALAMVAASLEQREGAKIYSYAEMARLNQLGRSPLRFWLLLFVGLILLVEFVVPYSLRYWAASAIHRNCGECELDIGSVGISLFPFGAHTPHTTFRMGKETTTLIEVATQSISIRFLPLRINVDRP